jgi:hypothetical protein
MLHGGFAIWTRAVSIRERFVVRHLPSTDAPARREV